MPGADPLSPSSEPEHEASNIVAWDRRLQRWYSRRGEPVRSARHPRGPGTADAAYASGAGRGLVRRGFGGRRREWDQG